MASYCKACDCFSSLPGHFCERDLECCRRRKRKTTVIGTVPVAQPCTPSGVVSGLDDGLGLVLRFLEFTQPFAQLHTQSCKPQAASFTTLHVQYINASSKSSQVFADFPGKSVTFQQQGTHSSVKQETDFALHTQNLF